MGAGSGTRLPVHGKPSSGTGSSARCGQPRAHACMCQHLLSWRLRSHLHAESDAAPLTGRTPADTPWCRRKCPDRPLLCRPSRSRGGCRRASARPACCTAAGVRCVCGGVDLGGGQASGRLLSQAAVQLDRGGQLGRGIWMRRVLGGAKAWLHAVQPKSRRLHSSLSGQMLTSATHWLDTTCPDFVQTAKGSSR